MQDALLPDYCISGRALESVDGIVVHYFSGRNVDPDRKYEPAVCLDLFKDLNRPKDQRELYMKAPKWPDGRMYASAHVLIDRVGNAFKLVEFDKQAYHAGRSILNGRRNCNRWTLGVELIGDSSSGFSREQYFALADFIVPYIDAGMPRENVAGHDFVRWQAIQQGEANKKKYDPSGAPNGEGDNFDWFYLWKLVNDQTEKSPAEAGLPDDRIGLDTRYDDATLVPGLPDQGQ